MNITINISITNCIKQDNSNEYTVNKLITAHIIRICSAQVHQQLMR